MGDIFINGSNLFQSKGKLAFGIWGYRDAEEIASIEYNTRNMTSEFLGAEDFLKVMADVKETTVDSVDVAEDMFGGVEQAILHTKSLEVRLLISKRQLDSLAVMLNEIVAAGRENQSSSDDFFTSLQSVSAAASRNADQIAKATTLQEAGLVPAFLEGLPYKSQIMNMSSELWASWGPDEQDQFIESLVGKVEAYKTLHNTPDNWVALNAGDSADDHVTPILLELLP